VFIKTEEYLRLIPSGSWSSDRTKLIDPEGNKIELQSEGLTDLQKALYSSFMASVANEIVKIIDENKHACVRVGALTKELEHFKGRHRERYNRALQDALDQLYEMPINSQVVRDTITEAAERIGRLANGPGKA
jgi:hypothetical protein